MSFRGVVEARCPKGCEAFEAEVWSFIHGRNSPELRELAVAKECNLLLCPACGAPFFAEAPYIYFEPEAEILAFVFPESFQGQEPRWRRKMNEDFAALKRVLGEKMPFDMEPEVFFGPEGLSELLSGEDFRSEEREVMECVAKELGLSLFHVSPRFARLHVVPSTLPYSPAQNEGVTRQNLIAGLEKLLAANDRLEAYQACLASLRSGADQGLPPARRETRRAATSARA
ncbi:MAG TPA: hypothetical protein DEB40_01820 [Elusimicrobia bacterium]|nr:hypothetical protein [Elusimicrobiota bacterium]HBT60468.1 hypothetical protein [Elusimicrobiota bacterium]